MRRPAPALFALLLAVSVALAACGGGDSDEAAKPKRNDARQVYESDQPVVPAQTPEDEAPKGEVIASLPDWQTEEEGFSFANYGEHNGEDLTPAEMRRLFGDGVCAGAATDACELVPAAAEFMRQINESMKGGHCFGFSVNALRFFTGKADPLDFGGNNAFALSIFNNNKLSREIAYAFAMQALPAVQDAYRAITPSQAVEFWKEAFADPQREAYTLGIYLANGRGGHAVTPYALEDMGGGRYGLVMYDNNHPGKRRVLVMDTNYESWSYNGATNPDTPEALFAGKGATNPMIVIPLTPGLQPQPCPFCEPAPPIKKDEEQPEKREEGPKIGNAVTVSLGGNPVENGDLRIRTKDGKRIGTFGGKIVNQVDGARVIRPLLNAVWKADPEPIYQLPAGVEYEIEVTGAGPRSDARVSVTGPGFAAAASGLADDPDATSVLTVGATGRKIAFATKGDSARPTLRLATTETGADTDARVSPRQVAPGGRLTLAIDTRDDRLAVAGSGAKRGFTASIRRVDRSGTETFRSAGTKLGAGEGAVLDYQGLDEGDRIPLRTLETNTRTLNAFK